jgi:hypothetical protein
MYQERDREGGTTIINMCGDKKGFIATVLGRGAVGDIFTEITCLSIQHISMSVSRLPIYAIISVFLI